MRCCVFIEENSARHHVIRFATAALSIITLHENIREKHLAVPKGAMFR